MVVIAVIRQILRRPSRSSEKRVNKGRSLGSAENDQDSHQEQDQNDWSDEVGFVGLDEVQ